MAEPGDVRVVVGRQTPRCPYCHEEVAAGGVHGCPGCTAWHHADCWREAGRCAACGFVEPGATPLTAPPRADPKASEPSFADKLQEWPDRNLHEALAKYFDDYDAAQRRAIYEELERREAAAAERGEPPSARGREQDRGARALKALVWLGITCGMCLLSARGEAYGLVGILVLVGLPLGFNLLFRVAEWAVPPRS